MPRRSYKGRAKLKYPMSFKKMCSLVGISPVQRVKLVKLMRESQNRGEVEQKRHV